MGGLSNALVLILTMHETFSDSMSMNCHPTGVDSKLLDKQHVTELPAFKAQVLGLANMLYEPPQSHTMINFHPMLETEPNVVVGAPL